MKYLFLLSISLVAVLSEKDRLDVYLVKKFAEFSAAIIAKESGGDTRCAEAFQALIIDTYKTEPWALNMLDASAKAVPGILTGNVIWAGNYDQCLDVYSKRQKYDVRGQYCTVGLTPSVNHSYGLEWVFDFRYFLRKYGLKNEEQITDIAELVRVTVGVCLPHACSTASLQNIWNFAEDFFKLPIHVQYHEMFCDYRERPLEKYWIDPYIITFFLLVLGLAAVSTICDIFNFQNNEFLTMFSLFSNSKKLFSTNSRDPTSISCLDGIKVLSMFWIIQGHRFIANLFSPNINSAYAIKWKDELRSSFLAAGPLSVDTFLTISGILLIYTKLNYGRNVSLSTFYGYRLIRIMPALIAVMLFYIGIIKHLGDGPGWRGMSRKLSGVCYSTWWVTLLQLTNFLPIEYQCVEQSWYLALDSQLYFVSPLIVFNIQKHPVTTLVGVVSVLVAAISRIFVNTLRVNYGTIFFDLSTNYLNHLYYPTMVRMPPWLVGICAGYFIYKYKKQNLQISKVLNVTLWVTVLSVMLGTILYHIIMTGQISNLHAAFFNALVKVIWSLCISWVIFACATNNGGVINTFLSLPVFQLLGKLTYSMYLTHLGVILVLAGSQKTTKHLSDVQTYHDFFGDLCFTVIAALILCLLFESPFLALIKILDKKKMKNAPVDEKSNAECRKSGRSSHQVSPPNRKDYLKLK